MLLFKRYCANAQTPHVYPDCGINDLSVFIKNDEVAGPVAVGGQIRISDPALN